MGSRSERTFLIVASSGRSLAASARRAGHRVCVADLFADSDLDEMGVIYARVSRGVSGGFDTDDLLTRADEIAPPGRKPPFGVVYGSGFEDRPALLARLAEGRELFGNGPQVLAQAKDPFALAEVIDALGLRRPEIARHRPDDDGAWLAKRIGGAGGIHIRYARASDAAEAAAVYWQRFVEGEPVSALVLADGLHAMVLGFSEQWPAPGSLAQPFRFGGAAAPASLPDRLAGELAAASTAIARSLALTGLNSVDFIAERAREIFHVIEVNPRPGGSLDAFERILERPLFDLHVRACCGDLPPLVARRKGAAASAILYADRELAIGPDYSWPEWTADRPRAGTTIKAGEPVCTVFADTPGGEGKDENPPALAREIASARSEALRAALARCMQSSFARDPAAPTPRDTGEPGAGRNNKEQ